MHIIQEEIGLPKIVSKSLGDNRALFSVEPLPSGYGMTLGNGLRRVLLSTLPGSAIIAVKVEGVSHEYSTVKGAKDSVLDIVLNLKGVFLQKHTKGKEKVTLDIKKEGPVTAGDIKCSSDIQILNPEYVITTIEKGGHLKMELIIDKGVGYSPAAERKDSDEATEYILVDAIYSPIRKVRYDVVDTRVGDRTNLDKLEIEIETNGSITPEDALKFSANILKSYFSLFDMSEMPVEADFMSDFSKAKSAGGDTDDEVRESYTPIEILGLSPRTLNALINGGVGSVEQLTLCSMAKLSSLRGFGKKAMDEVDDALGARGLALLHD